jgi:hypothetical protein
LAVPKDGSGDEDGDVVVVVEVVVSSSDDGGDEYDLKKNDRNKRMIVESCRYDDKHVLT